MRSEIFTGTYRRKFFAPHQDDSFIQVEGIVITAVEDDAASSSTLSLSKMWKSYRGDVISFCWLCVSNFLVGTSLSLKTGVESSGTKFHNSWPCASLLVTHIMCTCVVAQ